MTAFRLLGCALVCLLGPSCLAQGLTVRVINANNGHPLPNESVTISLLYMKGERRPVKYNTLVTSKTDAEGEAHFTLPTPAPVSLAAQVYLSTPYWHCVPCLVLTTTEEVIQKGIVGPLPQVKSKKVAAAIKPVPGQILFVARPFSFLERLLYPLLKD